MPNRHRLAGRFFCVLIALVIALPITTSGASPTLCQINDVVYLASGQPAQGQVVILWSAFTTADGEPIAAGELTVQLGAQGQFTAGLAPNTGATPAGSYYRVTYKLSDGTTSQEYWTVPATASTTIGAIRSKLVPANAAAQMLTREWAEGVFGSKSGANKRAAVLSFVQTAVSATDAVANKNICDPNKFTDGLGKVIDGVVQCLNASVWANK